MARPSAISTLSGNDRAEQGETPPVRVARNAREDFDMLGKRTYGKEESGPEGPRENQESNVAIAAPLEGVFRERYRRYNLLETRKSIKSARGMPWLSEAKKDVTSCEKPGGGANIR